MVAYRRSLIVVALSLQMILLLLPLAEPQAQVTYSVGKEWVRVWVNTDGSIDILYNITVTYNSGSPQGIVTVGMPKGGFTVEYAKDISGTSLRYADVSDSTVLMLRSSNQ